MPQWRIARHLTMRSRLFARARKSGLPDLRNLEVPISGKPEIGALARPGHESEAARAIPDASARSVRLIDSQLTMSNSAVFFVPAARLCARVCLSCSPRPCPRLRCRGRRNLGGNPGSSNPIAPRTRGGWSADRRTLSFCRACEARPPCPGATGTPLGAPPWRFSAGDPCRPLRQWDTGAGSDLPAPGHKAWPAGSRTSRGAVRAAAAGRHSPLRLGIVSGDAPPERGCATPTTASRRSQQISSYRSQ